MSPVLERVRSVIDDDRVQVAIKGDEGVDPSPISDPGAPQFQMLARTIRQVVTEEVVVAPFLVPGGTDAKYYSGRSTAVFRFIPAVMEASAMKLAHGTDERMPVESYLSSIRFFQQLIRNADAM